ncbi:MAG: nucleotide exchange factor GrpE [Pseudomonadota bacterium]
MQREKDDFPLDDDPALEIDVEEDEIEIETEEEAEGELNLDGLIAERDALQDRLLRSFADLENTRKRAERDRRDAETYGGTKLARDLLGVYDNLDRALAALPEERPEELAPLIEGIELTKKELLNAFEKHKITRIAPENGEKFDPKLHQAMFEAPLPGAEPGTVIQVMTEGFMISDRLLRPAQVGVASGA